jgi:hypothetical protein
MRNGIKLLNNKYLIIIIIYFSNITYPVRCLRVPQVDYH